MVGQQILVIVKVCYMSSFSQAMELDAPGKLQQLQTMEFVELVWHTMQKLEVRGCSINTSR